MLKILATGKSEISDKWSVEDVEIGGVHYRRLIFLSSSNVTQSEARVISAFPFVRFIFQVVFACLFIYFYSRCLLYISGLGF